MHKRSGEREALLDECARLIIDEGYDDYEQVKRRAQRNLDLPRRAELPSNAEIEMQVLERQRLFEADGHDQRVRMLRELALELMREFSGFDPHLVGSVLKGTATAYAPIQLHLFSDDVKNVAIELLNRNITFDAIERRKHKGNRVGIRGVTFVRDGVPVEILVFPAEGLRIPPPSPIDGKPMRRANIERVQQLLTATTQGV